MALTRLLLLLVLRLLEGLAFSGVKVPFFYDIAAHTKFLLAIPVWSSPKSRWVSASGSW